MPVPLPLSKVVASKRKAPWDTIAIALPGSIGVLLLLMVLSEKSLLSRGVVQIHDLFVWEMPIVLLGCGGAVVLSIALVRWLFLRQWGKIFISVLSLLIFLVCFNVAGAMGGAFLNAT